MEVNKGIIRGFRGSWGSGLGFLLIEDAQTGLIEPVPCDNGPTVRALQAAFGGTIAGGHTVNPDGAFIGQAITWGYDDLGLCLGWFEPGEVEP